MTAVALAVILVTGQVGPVELGGSATWYDYHQGQAAAGPALRSALGSDWRGQVVTVEANGRSVTVRLTDWCACGMRGGRDTLIDLDDADFAHLAPLGRGVITVTIEVGGPDVTLPPTDTEPYWAWPGGGPR